MVSTFASGRNLDYADRSIIAKLAISIARKMNALIFLVPEDIVDVRPRLVSSSILPFFTMCTPI